MELFEFVESYLKERSVKLLPHQKDILKAIAEGKMIYTFGSRSGKSILAEAIKAYKERERE